VFSSNIPPIPPPDIHQIPNYIWVWILSRLTSSTRFKDMVTATFGLLSHLRNEYRKFKDEPTMRRNRQMKSVAEEGIQNEQH
jgi:hypothetical protein